MTEQELFVDDQSFVTRAEPDSLVGGIEHLINAHNPSRSLCGKFRVAAVDLPSVPCGPCAAVAGMAPDWMSTEAVQKWTVVGCKIRHGEAHDEHMSFNNECPWCGVSR